MLSGYMSHLNSTICHYIKKKNDSERRRSIYQPTSLISIFHDDMFIIDIVTFNL